MQHFSRQSGLKYKPSEGHVHVTDVGRDAVDAGSACDERADAYGEVVWF
jgi:hypothetical protein